MTMARKDAGGVRADDDAERGVLEELRQLAQEFDPQTMFFSARMDLLHLDTDTVAYALARAGAVEDARRLIERVKSSSRRGPLRAVALALAARGEADAARQAARE